LVNPKKSVVLDSLSEVLKVPLTTIDQAHICPVLVGRSTQFRIVQKLIEQVGGHTTLSPIILISGEAGIGKSRLMSEAKVRASEKGFTILNGRCFEPDRTVPYAPLIDLSREYYASRPSDEIRRRFVAAASELVRILPELRDVFPDINPPPPITSDQEKHRLFDSLTQFFTEFSEPILIAIEDLH